MVYLTDDRPPLKHCAQILTAGLRSFSPQVSSVNSKHFAMTSANNWPWIESVYSRRTLSSKQRNLPESSIKLIAFHSFLDNLDRLFGPDYLPTDEDILRAQLPSTGISETIFDSGHEGPPANHHVFDVGRMRYAKEKWLPIFDQVDMIVFTASLSWYRQPLANNPNEVSDYSSYSLLIETKPSRIECTKR
jgi:hypothetical protein